MMRAPIMETGVCFLFAVITLPTHAQPSFVPPMLTREEAAHIALRVVQATGYPARVEWLAVQDLPAGIEVYERDERLQAQLALQNKNHVPTMYDRFTGWLGQYGPYVQSYCFVCTFDRWPGKSTCVYVNAWTGFCRVENWRERKNEEPGWETNTELGLGNFAFKSQGEIREIALQMARNLLGAGEFRVYMSRPDLLNDPLLTEAWYKLLVVKVDTSSGAYLPQLMLVNLNARTGWLEEGLFWNRPVIVSTTPNISLEQARQIADNYVYHQLGVRVAEWLEPGWNAARIIELPGSALSGLQVWEEDMLTQRLVWCLIGRISLRGGERYEIFEVDAHTGEVLVEGVQAKSRSSVPEVQRHHQTEKQARLLYLNGYEVSFFTPLVLRQGRVYLALRYVPAFGVQWNGKSLAGRAVKSLQPRLVLRRQKVGYVPLRDVCRAAGIRLHWDNQRKIPVLYADWLDVKRLLKR
ncbi:MAG: hypothetical protein RMM08_09905 [Armatimonadota bacterium]|nr:hypothetical protein [bacterium]MDW8321667.1 hypothetical protein [Armatimonadota bacterium]